MNDTLADFLNLLGLALSTVALVGWLCTTDVFSRGKQAEENTVPQTECTTTAPGSAGVVGDRTGDVVGVAERSRDTTDPSPVEQIDGRNDARVSDVGQGNFDDEINGAARSEKDWVHRFGTNGFDESPVSNGHESGPSYRKADLSDVRDGNSADEKRSNGGFVDPLRIEKSLELLSPAQEPVDEVEDAEDEPAYGRDWNGVVLESLK